MEIGRWQDTLVPMAGGVGFVFMALGKMPRPTWLARGFGAKALPVLGPLLIAFGIFQWFAYESQDQDARDAVREYRKGRTFPVRIDEHVQLDAVYAPTPRSVENHFTISSTEQISDADLQSRLEVSMAELACGPALRRVRERGFVFTSVYFDAKGNELARVRVPFETCSGK